MNIWGICFSLGVIIMPFAMFIIFGIIENKNPSSAKDGQALKA